MSDRMADVQKRSLSEQKVQSSALVKTQMPEAPWWRENKAAAGRSVRETSCESCLSRIDVKKKAAGEERRRVELRSVDEGTKNDTRQRGAREDEGKCYTSWNKMTEGSDVIKQGDGRGATALLLHWLFQRPDKERPHPPRSLAISALLAPVASPHPASALSKRSSICIVAALALPLAARAHHPAGSLVHLWSACECIFERSMYIY